jgi:Fic-DOC domain mobile mystery protein B
VRTAAHQCAHPGCIRRTTNADRCWQHTRGGGANGPTVAPTPPTSPDDSAPISDDEAEALMPGVRPRSRGEIDRLEHQGLFLTASSLLRRLDGGEDASFLWDDHKFRAAHQKAFGGVWTWGGKYRSRDTNIGVDPPAIATSMRMLMNNARTWREHKVYGPAERALRFHAEVGRVHPFPNGNGRLSRVYAEAMLYSEDREIAWGWSRSQFAGVSIWRRRYIDELREAERANDFAGLVEFAQAR